MLLNLYGMVKSIGTDLTGIANTDKTLLWNALARIEPGIAVTDDFLLIATVGAETFKSDKAYRNILAIENRTTRPWFDASGNAVSYNNINYYEPVVASTPGGQNALPFVVAEHSPIDYLLMAYGIGFDWDFSQRAGMHFRYKYATHADKNLPSNDWSGSFLFGEMKIWF
jgi:hypothetical protein